MRTLANARALIAPARSVYVPATYCLQSANLVYGQRKITVLPPHDQFTIFMRVRNRNTAAIGGWFNFGYMLTDEPPTWDGIPSLGVQICQNGVGTPRRIEFQAWNKRVGSQLEAFGQLYTSGGIDDWNVWLTFIVQWDSTTGGKSRLFRGPLGTTQINKAGFPPYNGIISKAMHLGCQLGQTCPRIDVGEAVIFNKKLDDDTVEDYRINGIDWDNPPNHIWCAYRNNGNLNDSGPNGWHLAPKGGSYAYVPGMYPARGLRGLVTAARTIA